MVTVKKVIPCLLISAAVITYLILMVFIFNEIPSFNQIWFEINDGISLINNHKIDYSLEINEIKQQQQFDITPNYSNETLNRLSKEILEPWVNVRARIQHRKKLANNNHKRGKKKGMSPWKRQCSPKMEMQVHHDSIMKKNIFTPSLNYVNFSVLKDRLSTILSMQVPMNNNAIALKSFNKNIINNKKLRQCGYKGKVFGIGMFKTGTTSLNLALSFLGYKDNAKTSIYKWLKQYPCNYGHWYLILRHYFDLILSLISVNDGEILLDTLRRSQISYNFGDFPMLYFWPFHDMWYPKSKFILTIRNSSAKFVNSVMLFCLQLTECMLQFTEKEINKDLVNLTNFRWNKYDEIDGVELAHYMAMIYELHNERIINYFTRYDKLNDLLILNIDEYKDNPNKNQWKDIMEFLGCHNDTIIKYAKYPHVNPTKLKYNLSIEYLLPSDYELDWRIYFKNKLPIMRTQHKPVRKIWLEYQDYDYYDLI